MGAQRHLTPHRFEHGGMRMPEKQGPMAAEVVDVLVVVDVPFARSARACHVDRIRRGGARVVRKAGWNNLARLEIKRLRTFGTGAIRGFDAN